MRTFFAVAKSVSESAVLASDKLLWSTMGEVCVGFVRCSVKKSTADFNVLRVSACAFVCFKRWRGGRANLWLVGVNVGFRAFRTQFGASQAFFRTNPMWYAGYRFV